MDRSTAAVRLLAGDKEPVRLASTANLPLTGLAAVDGVVPVAGDRVLVKDQTNATQNGIYTASLGTWRRAPDAAQSRMLIAGMKVAVQEGTEHGGDVWNLDTDSPNIGDDDIEWSFYLSTDIVGQINDAAQDGLDAIIEAGNELLAEALNPYDSFLHNGIAEMIDPEVPPSYIRTAFLNGSKIDGSDGLYEKVVSAPPANWPSFQILEGSYYQYRGRRTWKPEMFGAVGDGVTNDDAAFARLMSVLGDGDTIDFGNKHFALSNDMVFPARSRLQLVGNPKMTFAARAEANKGKLFFSSCHGLFISGHFVMTGAENSTSWAAIGSELLRSESRPLIGILDSENVRMQGIFETAQTSTVVTARTSTNFLCDGVRHHGWLADLPSITSQELPAHGIPDAQYLMTVRLLGSQGATVRNTRSRNHGSAVVNGFSARYVTVVDTVVSDMYDQGVYNSSGDDFSCLRTVAHRVRGSAVKSRGARSTVDDVRASSCVSGVTVSAIPGENAVGASVTKVFASTGHIAVFVDDVLANDDEPDGVKNYITDVDVSHVHALDMRGTGATIPLQALTRGGVSFTYCVVDGYNSDTGLVIVNGTQGEGNGRRGVKVSFNTFRNGARGIELDYVDQYELSYNHFHNISQTNVATVLEGFWGVLVGNTSSDITKRIFLHNAFGDGCKYNSAINNRMGVTGATALNEYWGNTNKQLVSISGNVPFKVGQMGFDSSTGKAMVSEGTSGTSDWKLLY